MTRVLATTADAGRACPYCRFPLKEGVTAERCDACGCLHHEDCWIDGNGCAVLGCAGGGTLAGAAGARALPAQLTSPDMSPPGPSTYTPFTPPFTPPAAPKIAGGALGAAAGLRWLILASLIAVAGIGAGALIATRALSGGGKPAPASAAGSHPAAQTSPGAQAQALTPAREASARQAIMGVLADYQSDYSAHNLGGLSSIFSPRIKRHGLAAGGCSVVQGRGAVLGDYASQFAQGTGQYTLVGLTPSQIAFDGPTRAHIDSNYRIATGGAGFVDFYFAREAGAWKITQVYATCA